MDISFPCGLLAHAVVRLSVEAVNDLRRRPIQGRGEPFAVSALKHFDEQTLAVLAAVRQALLDARLDVGSFADWGILAGPRYLGRAQMQPNIARFHEEGAWGVSPHLIPHRSLHAISGSVSQFFRSHGPNFGVGGGPGADRELLVAGATLLESLRLPGVWLLFSRIEPELPPAETGRPNAAAFCEAIALALVPPGRAERTVTLSTATTFAALADTLEALRPSPFVGVPSPPLFSPEVRS